VSPGTNGNWTEQIQTAWWGEKQRVLLKVTQELWGGETSLGSEAKDTKKTGKGTEKMFCRWKGKIEVTCGEGRRRVLRGGLPGRGEKQEWGRVTVTRSNRLGKYILWGLSRKRGDTWSIKGNPRGIQTYKS